VINEQRRINAEFQASGSNRGDIGAAPYHYPPILTRAYELLAPLGDSAFVAITDLVFLAAGILGLEVLLAALAWRDRWWPRLLYMTSLPVCVLVISSNPTSFLLLAWATAFFAVRKGRPVLGGALLAIGLIKPPVAIPVAAALILATPGARSRLLAGFGAGVATFAGLNLLAGVPDTLAWAGSLVSFTGTLDPNNGVVLRACCLSNVSSPFLGLGLGTVPANLIGLVLVAVPLLWLLRRGTMLDLGRRQPLVLLALLMAAGLAVTPYIHPYDMQLEAMPLLVLASLPLSRLSRVTFVLWATSVPISLVISVSLLPVVHQITQPWSYGVVLSAATLLALTVGAARLSRGTAPAAAQAVPSATGA
jgi:hypothetical protein